MIARVVLAVAAVAMFSHDVPTQSLSYGVLDLGTLGGAAAPGPDISEFGYTVVGQAQNAAGAYHAFADGYDGRKDLGTLGGATSSAFSVNHLIVGQAQTSSGQTRAFSFESNQPGATMKDLGTLGGTWSAAYGVEYLTIVGASRVAGNARLDAFIHSNGTMAALAASWGGDSVAKGIRGGQVVGYACTAGNASCRAVKFAGGVATELFTLGGNSVANAVNYDGAVAGTSFLSGSATKRAVFHSDGASPLDLGTLGGLNSEALDLNSNGAVVGTADTAASGPHAFLWDGGVMTDLNDLLPAGSGWVLKSATGISDGGQIVGTGTLNGVARAFLMTPPTDLALWIGGARSQTDSNLPRGVEAGRNIRFVVSVQGFPDGRTVYGARLTDTLTGPAEYVSITGYDSTGSECQVSPRVITCDVPPIDTIGSGREYLITVRATAAGKISHQSVISGGAPDPNPSNNRTSEDNWSVSLAALSLTPASLAGGKASSARVTLTDVAPYSNDATVRLSSSNPAIAAVPATIVVVKGSTSRAFNIIPAVVSAPTAVQITASYGLETRTQTLTVLPPALSQLYLTPTTIIGGCGTSAGKIMLTGAAPAGGAVVPLSNTNSAAIVPANVTVPAGASVQTFTITTRTVTANAGGTVSASYGGASRSLPVTVRPIRVKTLVLAPNPVTGGASVSGSFALECAAPAGGVVVALSSSNTAAAAPTVSSVVVPAGATTGSFSLRTSRVTASTAVSVHASAYGVRKSTTLTVKP